MGEDQLMGQVICSGGQTTHSVDEFLVLGITQHLGQINYVECIAAIYRPGQLIWERSCHGEGHPLAAWLNHLFRATCLLWKLACSCGRSSAVEIDQLMRQVNYQGGSPTHGAGHLLWGSNNSYIDKFRAVGII